MHVTCRVKTSHGATDDHFENPNLTKSGEKTHANTEKMANAPTLDEEPLSRWANDSNPLKINSDLRVVEFNCVKARGGSSETKTQRNAIPTPQKEAKIQRANAPRIQCVTLSISILRIPAAVFAK
jgi:hypothetical protein